MFVNTADKKSSKILRTLHDVNSVDGSRDVRDLSGACAPLETLIATRLKGLTEPA